MDNKERRRMKNITEIIQEYIDTYICSEYVNKKHPVILASILEDKSGSSIILTCRWNNTCLSRKIFDSTISFNNFAEIETTIQGLIYDINYINNAILEDEEV
jgi:hypothetical protein